MKTENEIKKVRKGGNNQRVVNLPKTFNFGDYVIVQKIKVPRIKIKPKEDTRKE
jgi:hypothetical protein